MFLRKGYRYLIQFFNELDQWLTSLKKKNKACDI